MLEQGEVEQVIIQQCLRENLPFPERIANAPELLPGLELYYVAFTDLSDSRSIGMSLGPIPWKAVRDYCIILGLNEDQTEDMHYHIRRLDATYLAHVGKK